MRWAAGVIVLLSSSPALAAPKLVLKDALTQALGGQQTVVGGSFSSAGWKRDGFDSKLIYDLGAPITAGRVRFQMDGVNGVNHGVGGFPDCRAIFAAVDNNASGNIDDPGNESVQFLWAWAMEETDYCNGGPGGFDRTNRMKLLVHGGAPNEPGEPMSDPQTWDITKFYQYEIGWNEGHAWLLRDGAMVLDQVYPSAPVVMNLRYVFLGTVNRYKAGVKNATYRELEVWDDGGPAATDAGADATGPDAAVCLGAGPQQTGAGSVANIGVTYSNCEGASAWRIVQVWVGDEVKAGVPAVSADYEAGMLHLGGDSCAPGSSKILQGPYGSLDCAATKVVSSGNDLTVSWALSFDTSSFTGVHRIFVDAKGGSATPEPRLGWTELGTFTVSSQWSDGGLLDGGKPDAGAPASGSTELADPECGCRAPGSGRAQGAALIALGLVAWGMSRARRRG